MRKNAEIIRKSVSEEAAGSLYEVLFKRASVTGNCPVESLKAFTDLCLSQSCGKCTPCRIGLKQVSGLLDSVLSGDASEETLSQLTELAGNIRVSSDCAIGFEAGRKIGEVLTFCREDLISHVEKGECTAKFHSVPCRNACPTHVDIPAYIALTKEGRYKDAVRVIRYDNPFPSVCALICEHPCEAGCRRSLVDAPVNIRELKRVAVDNAGNVPVPACMEKTGKKVAVIGGGPSGLTAAYYLELMGHEVTVFERREKLGGMTRYGIPRYRLPESYLEKDIEAILSTGVKAVTDTDIDEKDFAEMVKAYDCVYLSIGAHNANTIGIPGEDADGVLSAVRLLRDMGDGRRPSFKGKNVVIVGGGNVAMDCTRTAKRLGAKSVKCVYRRRIEDMTALPDEVAGAIAEGCEVLPMLAPVSIETGEDGKVRALLCQPQIPGTVDRGRPKPVKADREPVRIPCDIVISAIGQVIDSTAFVKAGVPANRGRIAADSTLFVCEIGGKKIFAGGDAFSGPSTVVRAVEAGKTAAMNIDSALGYDHLLERTVEIPAAKAGSAPATGRIDASERPAAERKGDFRIMAQKLTKEEASHECDRCLRCDHYGCGAFRNGREEQ